MTTEQLQAEHDQLAGVLAEADGTLSKAAIVYGTAIANYRATMRCLLPRMNYLAERLAEETKPK
jgi:hypothetical protein